MANSNNGLGLGFAGFDLWPLVSEILIKTDLG
jgi:hypothetical protein